MTGPLEFVSQRASPPASNKGKGEPGRRRMATLGLLWRTSSAHRRSFVYGALATLGVVAMRLALPWPLRGVVENVFPAGTQGQDSMNSWLGQPENAVILFCLAYFLLAVGTGVFEWTQRVFMARTASATAHDFRAAAVAAAGSGPERNHAGRADLITRIIGDSARLKADLKGILIHLSQNALLLLAITGLFLYLAPKLGLLFLTSGVLAILIGYFAVEEVAETTKRQRKKESKYAAWIHTESLKTDARQGRSLNRSSARKEVRVTRIMGRSSLLIHAAVAATLGYAFWIGVKDVRLGVLSPGGLFLFIAYAITIQRRAVMIGRQVARGGKLLANAERIGRLFDGVVQQTQIALPLNTGIQLNGLRLKASAPHGKQPRLGPLDLEIARGERLLVVGGPGSGKSSLLGVVAGRAQVKPGRLLWDGEDVGDRLEAVRESVAYLPEEIEFGSVTVRWLLGLKKNQAPDDEDRSMLKSLGASKVICGLRDGLEQTVASGDLSRRERRSLVLAGIVRNRSPLWVLDSPVDGETSQDRDRVAVLLERAARRTLVVALRRPLLVERFDRILLLKQGRIEFHGTPAEWTLRRQQLREIRNA